MFWNDGRQRAPRTSLTLVTAPTGLPVTLDDVKSHAVVETSEANSSIEGMMAGAVATMDGGDGFLGRALMPQQWELRLDWFPWEIEIQLPPLQTIDAFTYIDKDGVSQSISSTLYQIVKGGTQRSRLTPAYGHVWPSHRYQRDAITLKFTCGYASADAVPAPIKSAIYMYVAHLLQNKAAVTDGRVNQPFEMPFGVAALLAPYRVSFF